MDFGIFGDTALTTLLPREIKSSLVCCASAKYEVIDNPPDLVTCHKNGFLYEIKNCKVRRSLNLNENASSVGCYFLSETGKIVLFYLVVTTGGRMMIIRRYEKGLKIVQDYDAVRDIQVYDFECLGSPKIKITFLKEEGSLLCKFPIESDTEADNFEDSSFTGDCLVDELQIINVHIDELTEEFNQVRKICFFSNAPIDFEKILVDSVRFSSPSNGVVQHKLMVSNKWLKVFGTSLIFGTKYKITDGVDLSITNCRLDDSIINDQRIIHDIQVTINHEEVKDYAYSFFQSLNDFDNYLFFPEEITGTVKPGEEIYVVVVFKVPQFFAASKFMVPFCVTCSNVPRLLLKDLFEVDVQDVASGTIVGIQDRFTMEDLIALKMSKCEIRIKMRSEDLWDCSLESLMEENLGFKRIRHVKDKLFYCTSMYLREVFVAIRHININPSVWNLLIFLSEQAQLFFLVSALYDLLPENAEILYDED